MPASNADRELHAREAVRRIIQNSPDPKKTGLLHDAIAIFVRIALEFGLEEHSVPGASSAYKLVAEEVGLSEATVVRLWNEQKTLVSRT